MKKISVGLIGIAALGLLGACSSTNGGVHVYDKDGKLEIVTTFYPMYDFTKNIVGDEANVDLMVPAGSEPHDYEPSAKDMAKAHDADVFVYHNENIPHQGEVSINNEDINKKLVKIAYVEQKADIDFTFPIKVKECVSMGTYAGMKVFQRIKNAEWQRVSKALEKVDMGKYSNHQIGELSGGQFQRVLLARCLAQNADFIFLDEPFVGIDLVSERIIMDTLKKLKHQGKTVLIVHHDLSKVKKYFDNIILLDQLYLL
ncbi:hypothetical protein EfmAA242_30440 [Enterococcus faecium]|nr:hypothetical protein EfmAA242_30440 [Enterococcus faecium]